jgi:uracil phosphoribosyltransferase
MPRAAAWWKGRGVLPKRAWSSAAAAVSILKEAGLRRIKFLGLIAAPEGVQVLSRSHPDVPLYLAAVDSHLNAQSYIVPGLGDAGDRQFGTH